MISDLLDVTCPGCGQDFPLNDADSPPADGTETECPHCGRALVVDGDECVTAEDEEADHELFTVDAEGELSAETLLLVTCPHCGCMHDAGEAGVTCCPCCRRLFPIDDQGRIDDGRGFHYECPRCGSLIEGGGREGEDESCGACGWYDPSEEMFGPDEEEEEEWDESAEKEVSSRPGFRSRQHGGPDRVLVVAADGSGDHRRIQDAVRVGWHSSIHIRPGRYEEALVLTQPMEIIADGPPGSVHIDGDEQTAVRIECGQVTLRGLSLISRGSAVLVLRESPLLEECSFQSADQAGVLVSGTARPLLRYCQMDGGAGVRVEERGLARLEECVIRSNVGVELIAGGRLDAWSCRFRSQGDFQVSVGPSCEAALVDCELTGSAVGVCLRGGAARLERCRVHECRDTGVLVGVGVAVLAECGLDHNGRLGLAVRVRGEAVLSRCQLEENRTNLLLSGRAIALMEDCDLGSHADAGLRARGWGRSYLRRCRLGGHQALLLSPAAEVWLEDCTLEEATGCGAVVPGGRVNWIRPARP